MKLDEALSKLEETVRTPAQAQAFKKKYQQFDSMAAKKYKVAEKAMVEAVALSEVAMALETVLEEIESGDDAADNALEEAKDRATDLMDRDAAHDFGVQIYQEAKKHVSKIRKF